MRKHVVTAILAGLLALGHEALPVAQGRPGIPLGKISKADKNVREFLVRVRCDPRWLSKVLSDSGLKPEEWDNPPLGRAMSLCEASCKTPPPSSVIIRSESIMTKAAAPKPAKKPQPEVGPVIGNPGVEEPDIESLKLALLDAESELKKTKEKLAASENENKEILAKKEADIQQASQSVVNRERLNYWIEQRKTAVIFFFVGMAITIIALLVWRGWETRRLRRFTANGKRA